MKKFILLTITIILVVVLSAFNVLTKTIESKDEKNDQVDLGPTQEEINACIENDFETEDMILLEQELYNKISIDYNMSFSYTSITNNNNISYDDEVYHYAASAVKILPALYIYQKALNDEIDLEEELKYYNTNKYYTIKHLVEQSLKVSDNSSYLTLYYYIGVDNLRDFAKSLGATNPYSTSDQYSYINLEDATHYLEALNDFIELDNEYSKELVSYFPTEKFKFYQSSEALQVNKYGLYNQYFNELSIVYEEQPYYLVLLTLHGYSDYTTLATEIHQIFYEFNQEYYQLKKAYCEN